MPARAAAERARAPMLLTMHRPAAGRIRPASTRRPSDPPSRPRRYRRRYKRAAAAHLPMLRTAAVALLISTTLAAVPADKVEQVS